MLKWGERMVAALIAAVPIIVVLVLMAGLRMPELPSLGGSIIGLAVYILLLKKFGIHPKRTWDFPKEVKKRYEVRIEEEKAPREFTMLEAILPYVLVALALVVTRTIPAVNKFVTTYGVVAVKNILGTGLAQTYKFLYNPGIITLVLTLLTNAILRLGGKHTIRVFKTTAVRVAPAAITLIFAVSLSQIMMNSGHKMAGLPSMLQVMAEAVAKATHQGYIMFAVFIGVLGAYLAGSNTVSNIMFGGFQYEIAKTIGLPKTIILALQTVGGAVGNMICVHNVVAVCATCGIIGKEGYVIRRNLLPVVIYALIVSIVATLVVFVLKIPMI